MNLPVCIHAEQSSVAVVARFPGWKDPRSDIPQIDCVAQHEVAVLNTFTKARVATNRLCRSELDVDTLTVCKIHQAIPYT